VNKRANVFTAFLLEEKEEPIWQVGKRLEKTVVDVSCELEKVFIKIKVYMCIDIQMN
jgi:hypothetical protein